MVNLDGVFFGHPCPSWRSLVYFSVPGSEDSVRRYQGLILNDTLIGRLVETNMNHYAEWISFARNRVYFAAINVFAAATVLCVKSRIGMGSRAELIKHLGRFYLGGSVFFLACSIFLYATSIGALITRIRETPLDQSKLERIDITSRSLFIELRGRDN